MIHGSGGGYDQGELLAQAVLGDGFHWIAPSRFGYLRSTFHEGATFDDQAHAYACLLDHLGIEKVAVVALSHGGPSALLFAALHPERVSSLTLISCGVASSDAPDQAQANRRGDVLTTIFKHDLRYWAVTKLFRRRLMKLMGADDTVVAGLTPEQRELVDRVIDDMNPVSPRAAGVAFDNKAAMPNERIAAVRAPDPDPPRRGRHAAALPQRRVRRRHHPGRTARQLRATADTSSWPSSRRRSARPCGSTSSSTPTGSAPRETRA